MGRDIVRCAIVLSLGLLAGCNPHRTSPPNRSYNGLPISGTLAFAQKAGFTNCFNTDAISMRCRRSDVMLDGQGPFEAAVDLIGYDGNGGFDLLTLWSDEGEMAVVSAGDALERKGWRSCITGRQDFGDQEIYTNPRVRFIFSMDVSYWMTRRLRLIPVSGNYRPPC